MEHEAPESGQIWTVGAIEDLEYVGVGFNFEQRKHLVFKDLSDGTYFIIEKDEFYSADLNKKRIK